MTAGRAVLQDVLEYIEGMREHDVPYHVRFAIDTGAASTARGLPRASSTVQGLVAADLTLCSGCWLVAVRQVQLLTLTCCVLCCRRCACWPLVHGQGAGRHHLPAAPAGSAAAC